MRLWVLLLLLYFHLGNAPWTEGSCSLPLSSGWYFTPCTIQRLHLLLQHGAFNQLPARAQDPLWHPLHHPSHLPQKSWTPVRSCVDLTAGQVCNLTREFKDPYSHYKARVQAFTPTQTSSWTESGWFQPLSDTVLGPPHVSVSGCGNCLILQLRVPETRGLHQDLQLMDLYRGVIFHVQRTRDGAQFRLNLPYSEETVITYLQPGVEYCVTVSVRTLFSSSSVSSKPYCAFTSPPPPRSSLHVVFGLLGAFCMLGFLLFGLVVYRHQLSSEFLRQCRSRTLSYTDTQ
ncbi:interferon alpha/beta receptor 2-like isoform X1 [Toxotes jaculatrix]|uniref:interferon alpha/beta receptor 2-like isoform X1 n=1 Tax=Toxotes jaculatrix TaxID=941984 RepID=UPI001B3A91BD|nr:interferon alpha/beta receptor 2-like isoform X1 [Toxotes jaculatrix]